MVFALETFWPSTDGWSAARIEEEIVVTKDGSQVITRFPAEDLVIAGKPYYTVGGTLPLEREVTSDKNTTLDADTQRGHAGQPERGRPALMPATLRDVAKLAAVHPGTVSRALNPETRRLVNDETARRVLRRPPTLDYRPNPIARGLKTNRSYTIGVLVPDLMNPLFPPIVRGIQDRLEQAGYTPLIANTDNDPERERNDFEAMRARQVDGVITATARLDHGVLDEMPRAACRSCSSTAASSDGPLPSATADDHEGARLAVEHLAALGHTPDRPPRRPAGGLHRPAALRGLPGRRWPQAGLEIDLGSCASAPRSPSPRARACAASCSTAARTAIVAGNDLMALGCYDVFAERGLRCPDDISVVGFNDMPFSERFNPPLTTIRDPALRDRRGGGRAAARAPAGPGAPARHVVLDAELVVRAPRSVLDNAGA